MPDHVHMALRGNINESPEEIALAIMNNTAYAMGQNSIWQRGFYVGTFSEYDVRALRGRV
jgi:REP element-mobilizing transposase RayT